MYCICFVSYVGSYLIAREEYIVKTNLSQVFMIVAVCIWPTHVKKIEHQSPIIKDLLVKTKCYNEPDAAALKQPFSLAFSKSKRI